MTVVDVVVLVVVMVGVGVNRAMANSIHAKTTLPPTHHTYIHYIIHIDTLPASIAYINYIHPSPTYMHAYIHTFIYYIHSLHPLPTYMHACIHYIYKYITYRHVAYIEHRKGREFKSQGHYCRTTSSPLCTMLLSLCVLLFVISLDPLKAFFKVSLVGFLVDGVHFLE